MSKRFTDTGLGRKRWFRLLTPKMKCAWRFLCDECDHAGLWEIDEDSFEYHIGEQVTVDECLEAFGDRVEKVGDKLFVRGFVEFQYGHLNPENRVHKSVLTRLEKLKIKPLISSLKGAKDTDTDTDTDKRAENLFNFWNENRGPFAKAQKLTDKRKTHALAQLEEYPSPDHWGDVLTKWKASDFCKKQWKPSFDDFLNENKRVKTLEGKYDDRNVEAQTFGGVLEL